jgi:ABC-type transport system involved in Fe-S cluster assembly fused permease/ATPase subunit
MMQVMRVLDRGTSAIQNILSTVVFAIGPQVLVPWCCFVLLWLCSMHEHWRAACGINNWLCS